LHFSELIMQTSPV